MKHISIKTAQMRLLPTLLLIMGTVAAHAQYMMNIRQTDGTKLRYAVSSVDSVWFDENEYVDLGLSVKWATCNLGAEKPEDYGDYYAWGETETKSTYDWYTYKYCKGSSHTMTKYCSNSSYGNNGTTDSRTTLEMSDDVARQKWGGSWRIPTLTEFKELINNCTWTWTTLNGVQGYRGTSKKSGYTDRSIFLPAAGYHNDTGYRFAGSHGNYWSCSLDTSDPCYAYEIYFYSGFQSPSNINRYYGLPVRPVRP